MEAFLELDSERHHGNGIQKIPWSCILKYGNHYEIYDEEFDDFSYHIRALDNFLIKRLELEQKANMKK